MFSSSSGESYTSSRPPLSSVTDAQAKLAMSLYNTNVKDRLLMKITSRTNTTPLGKQGGYSTEGEMHWEGGGRAITCWPASSTPIVTTVTLDTLPDLEDIFISVLKHLI